MAAHRRDKSTPHQAPPPTSVPHLLALAHGKICTGPHRCFYCGAPCGEAHSVAEYVKDSFTGRPGVVAPGSPWVCAGCVLCLREDCEITTIDGQVRRVPKGAMRAFSWVITQTARAASKAHVTWLRALCLDPPPPPYAIVLSDSGKTHQLYRGVVNHDRGSVTLTLEGERITYRPEDLAELLAVAGRVVAATGKPALDACPLGLRTSRLVIERYTDGYELIATWNRVGASPLGRLAAWLSPRKEDAQREYPSDLN